VRRYFNRLRDLAFSSTAKDTFIVFIGNLGSAFWGFLFTLFVARSLSISDFGVFSAVLNLVNMLSSLADIGISTGSVNFVSEYIGRNDEEKANEYVKASFITRLLIVMAISVVVFAFSPAISHKLLATTDSKMGMWVAIIPIFWFPDLFFPFILQARRKFLHSIVYDNSFYVGRLIFVAVFYAMGALTIDKAFIAFGAGFLMTVVLAFAYVRTDFYRAKPAKDEYKNLIRFSGWIGVNRIISSISGKLDIQMLAALSGAMATGLYSIPSRLAGFIVVLTGSYSSVLATRLAAFGDREKEKTYILKSTLAVIPMAVGIVFWIAISKPFIILLFGEKYLPSVPVFQALAASQIPFLFTAPAVTAIVYAMKKTVYIGVFSFFQLAAIFILNFILIPKFGTFGPTITFGVTNTILAIYTWVIVIKHYWIKNG
jgi:O-antigen/teichoic acid export membrane protein